MYAFLRGDSIAGGGICARMGTVARVEVQIARPFVQIVAPGFVRTFCLDPVPVSADCTSEQSSQPRFSLWSASSRLSDFCVLGRVCACIGLALSVPYV